MVAKINGQRQRVRCFRNADEIGAYIGEPARNIGRLVIDEDLPAWKRGGSGAWRAINTHLDWWMEVQARKYLPKKFQDAENDPERDVNM